MSWLIRTFKSFAGKKALAAISGLAIVLFLIIHLAGNLQIYMGSSAFNDYAHDLHAGPLIVLGDIGLLVLIPLHIVTVILLTRENKKARGAVGYKVHGTKQKRSKLAIITSKTMLPAGLLIALFVVAHIWHFRLQHEAISEGTFSPDIAAGDLKSVVIATLQAPHWAILYILGSLATGWHLFHGIQASFRSLGLTHKRYTPLIVKAGAGLSIVLALGFVSFPLWVMLG